MNGKVSGFIFSNTLSTKFQLLNSGTGRAKDAKAAKG